MNRDIVIVKSHRRKQSQARSSVGEIGDNTKEQGMRGNAQQDSFHPPYSSHTKKKL